MFKSHPHTTTPHSSILRRTLDSAKGSAWDPVFEFRAQLQPGPSHPLGYLWDSPDVLSKTVLFWCVHFLIKFSSHYSPFPPKVKYERKERSWLWCRNSGNLKLNLLAFERKWRRDIVRRTRYELFLAASRTPLSWNLHSDLPRGFPFLATHSFCTTSAWEEGSPIKWWWWWWWWLW